MLARACALLGLSIGLTGPAWSQVKEIPWGTAPVGSSGHKALVVEIHARERRVGPEVGCKDREEITQKR